MELPTSSQNWSWEGAWLRSTLTLLSCLLLMLPFVVVAQSCLTLCDPMDCSTPGFPVLHHLLEFAQAHVHWVSDAIQSSHPLLPPSPPDFNLSQHQGLFLRVSSLHQVPNYWSFSFSISPSNEYSGLIIFRIDWFELLAVQETLKSLLHHHNLKASVLECINSMVQLSHWYIYCTLE